MKPFWRELFLAILIMLALYMILTLPGCISIKKEPVNGNIEEICINQYPEKIEEDCKFIENETINYFIYKCGNIFYSCNPEPKGGFMVNMTIGENSYSCHKNKCMQEYYERKREKEENYPIPNFEDWPRDLPLRNN